MASIFSIRTGLMVGFAAAVGIGTVVWADSTANMPMMVIEHTDQALGARAAPEVSADAPIAAFAAPTEPAPAPLVIPQTPPEGGGDAFLAGAIDLDAMVEVDGAYRVALPDGRAAILTLDPATQKAAEKALRAAHAPFGAVVVMTVDGRILAYTGRRNAAPKKPRDFSLPGTVWAPAASVFKVVTASALIDAGVEASHEVCYHGGKRSIRRSNLVDDPRKDRRCDDLSLGVAKSLNALIAKLADRHLDSESLATMARAYGFGSAPAFALDVEPNHVDVPDKTTDDLEFARAAAGFWHSSLSPIGGAGIAATVATGGMRVTPRIVAELVDADGTRHAIDGVPPTRVVDEAIVKEVAEMMVGTTIRGSARKGFRDRSGRKYLDGMDIGGKTGTLTGKGDEYVQYSWFIGFGPATHPEVVIATLLGNGEVWHLKAHTVARMVLQATL